MAKCNQNTYPDCIILINTASAILKDLVNSPDLSQKEISAIHNNISKSLQAALTAPSQEEMEQVVKPLKEVKGSFKRQERLLKFVSAIVSIAGVFSASAKQVSEDYGARSRLFHKKVEHVEVLQKNLRKLKSG